MRVWILSMLHNNKKGEEIYLQFLPFENLFSPNFLKAFQLQALWGTGLSLWSQTIFYSGKMPSLTLGNSLPAALQAYLSN